MNKDKTNIDKLKGMDRLLFVMKRLRKDCPWDAAQTHHSLKQYLLEETYEVLETIDDERWDLLSSELGDILLQIVFHSAIADEKGNFQFDDVVDNITEKMIDRHPHVFGDKKLKSATEVSQNWEHLKVVSENRESILSGIPKNSPALLQAQRLQEKAATVGFEWDEVESVIEKIDEELDEFKTALQKQDRSSIEHEFGDLLFSLVNLSRYININSEDALRKTNAKFVNRFKHIEKQYQNDPQAMKNAPLDELDRHWVDAKKNE
ncbi:MAG: nucleoside triphosphate pyrophosphohydrolase [Calditrichaceae bacterium]